MSSILKALIFLILVQTVAVGADKEVKETDATTNPTKMLGAAAASIFEQRDHDKDGLLSLEEFSEMIADTSIDAHEAGSLKKADGTTNADAIGKLFKKADADADGKISMVEAPTLEELLDYKEAKGAGAFSLVAKDEDNSAADEDQGSSEEREELENQQELAELQKMWKEADTDKDGHLSFTEVKGAMEKAPMKFLNLSADDDEDEMIGLSRLGYEGLAQVCETAFKVSDQDKDGKLSNDEMLKFTHRVVQTGFYMPRRIPGGLVPDWIHG